MKFESFLTDGRYRIETMPSADTRAVIVEAWSNIGMTSVFLQPDIARALATELIRLADEVEGQ